MLQRPSFPFCAASRFAPPCRPPGCGRSAAPGAVAGASVAAARAASEGQRHAKTTNPFRTLLGASQALLGMACLQRAPGIPRSRNQQTPLSLLGSPVCLAVAAAAHAAHAPLHSSSFALRGGTSGLCLAGKHVFKGRETSLQRRPWETHPRAVSASLGAGSPRRAFASLSPRAGSSSAVCSGQSSSASPPYVRGSEEGERAKEDHAPRACSAFRLFSAGGVAAVAVGVGLGVARRQCEASGADAASGECIAEGEGPDCGKAAPLESRPPWKREGGEETQSSLAKAAVCGTRSGCGAVALCREKLDSEDRRQPRASGDAAATDPSDRETNAASPAPRTRPLVITKERYIEKKFSKASEYRRTNSGMRICDKEEGRGDRVVQPGDVVWLQYEARRASDDQVFESTSSARLPTFLLKLFHILGARHDTCDTMPEGPYIRARVSGVEASSSSLPPRAQSRAETDAAALLGAQEAADAGQAKSDARLSRGSPAKGDARPSSTTHRGAADDVPRPVALEKGFHQIIPALDEGIRGMRVGGVRELIVPPHLAYPSICDDVSWRDARDSSQSPVRREGRHSKKKVALQGAAKSLRTVSV
ncbi:peptidyl-prolyl cis-trans isomerase, FKBP-type domain-containing protein [Besnoitia besnoiti]|uniref:peptidylprolyl isomerase n=1 Tax=Besnoitia besnoiti TaxID=94643 RepID=A0A2A9MCZ5_BESBE|nr:peptidyl-prolyl cis-trans isomerase, FKBP-type domain-containing protein [Besnoitia besnoiti]PFH33252.1 peptidyl-prolyl cis-trans isomerase, FKBP-type domain-containing protein [Besnoitia besnoiti]